MRNKLRRIAYDRVQGEIVAPYPSDTLIVVEPAAAALDRIAFRIELLNAIASVRRGRKS